MEDKEFIEQYQKYHQEILRFCNFRLNHKSNAEDVAAETFIKLYKQDINSIDNIRAWLYQVARHTIYDKYVRKKTIDTVPVDEEFARSLPDENMQSMENQTIESELKQLVEAHLQDLDNDTGDIIIMRIWDEMKFADIAEAIEMKENAVKQRFYRGIKQLKAGVAASSSKYKYNSVAIPAILMGIQQLKPSFAVDSIGIITQLTNILNINLQIMETTSTAAGSSLFSGLLATTQAKVVAAATAGVVTVAGAAGVAVVTTQQTPAPDSAPTSYTQTTTTSNNDTTSEESSSSMSTTTNSSISSEMSETTSSESTNYNGVIGYNSFSMKRVEGWATTGNSQLSTLPFYDNINIVSDEILAVEKDDWYLIVSITAVEGNVMSEGLFNDDRYQRFIQTRDKVTISGEDYYLPKEHASFTDFANTETLAGMEQILWKFIPESENDYDRDSFQTMFVENGYAYIIFATSQNGGAPNPSLQNEMLRMLSTANFNTSLAESNECEVRSRPDAQVEGYVQIEQPCSGKVLVGDSFKVTGEAQGIFEGVLNYTLEVDATDEVISMGRLRVGGTQGYWERVGEIDEFVMFDNKPSLIGETGTFNVYYNSPYPKKTFEISIPVNFGR